MSGPVSRTTHARSALVILVLALSGLIGATGATSTRAEQVGENPSYLGIIKPRQVVNLGSPVAGIVDSLDVDRGDRVWPGQALVKLNSEVEQVDLALAEARVNVARNRYERQLALERKALASEADLEHVKMELELSEFERDRRAIFLAQRTINSPLHGTVTKRLVAKGEYINDQTPLLQIAQTNVLNVEIILPLTEHGRISKGMLAKVTPQAPISGTYTATVEVVDSVMDAASGTFGVRLTLKNKDLRIPSGIQCQVEFIVDSVAAKVD